MELVTFVLYPPNLIAGILTLASALAYYLWKRKQYDIDREYPTVMDTFTNYMWDSEIVLIVFPFVCLWGTLRQVLVWLL